MKKVFLIILIATGLTSFDRRQSLNEGDHYLSPEHICVNDALGEGYVSLSTAKAIAVVDLKAGRLKETINLSFNPGDIQLSQDQKMVYISDPGQAGSVSAISLRNYQTVGRIKTGHSPQAIALSRDGRQLYVANRFSNTLSVIETESFRKISDIPAGREPIAVAASPDGKTVAVANLLPDQPATDTLVSASVRIWSVDNFDQGHVVHLINGSQSLRDLIFSPDGHYLYVSHILSRNTLPTTQIEHGWINCNALSIIDVKQKKLLTCLLLDELNQGAANPAGMCLTQDQNGLIIALSGVHKLAVINLEQLHQRLEASSDQELEHAPYNFGFLQGLIARIPTTGISPRSVATYQNQIITAGYFSAHLELFDQGGDPMSHHEVQLGVDPPLSDARKGELYFCDATLCFQQWQSCLSCHPDGRSDALNWDLLNDGIGNPKNSKSLLFSHVTPPVMITGVRKSAEVAVRSGIRYILFSQVQEDQAACIDAYLKALNPIASPYLVNGELSESAHNGKLVFEKAGCGDCHSGNYFTDYRQYLVGTGFPPHEQEKFDVPTLREIWRTAPYLYDGRTTSLKEVFTRYNQNDQHGKTSTLTDKELNDLVLYVLSL